MRKDSGLMIVGALLSSLGGAVLFMGVNGTGVESPSGMRGSIHVSSEEAVVVGVALLLIGLLMMWQPKLSR